MEQKLLTWIYEQPIKKLMKKDIQIQAKSFSTVLGFKASKGWYERFIERNPSVLYYIQPCTKREVDISNQHCDF